MTLHVTARFVSRNDSREQLKNILIALVAPIRNDPGCNRCNFVQNITNPNEFVFIEEWKGQAELEAHLAANYVKTALDESSSLLSEAVDLKLLESVA